MKDDAEKKAHQEQARRGAVNTEWNVSGIPARQPNPMMGGELRGDLGS